MRQQLGNLRAQRFIVTLTDLSEIPRNLIILDNIVRFYKAGELPTSVKSFNLAAKGIKNRHKAFAAII